MHPTFDELYNLVPADPAVQGDIQRAWFLELEAEIRAYEGPLLPINVRLDFAAKLVLGCWDGLAPYHGEIMRLTGMTQAELLSVPKLAYAVLHINVEKDKPRTRRKSLRELHRVATKVREVLLWTYRTLGVCGLMDTAPLKKLEGPLSYAGCANDLTALAASLREAWPRIANRQALTLENLDQAGALAARLSKGRGEADHVVVRPSDLTELKKKAFSLLARRYDQVRRAMSFLRWNDGDFEKLTPSLYVGRNNGGRKKRAAARMQEAGEVAPAEREATATAPVQAASVATTLAHATPSGVDGISRQDAGQGYGRAEMDRLLTPPMPWPDERSEVSWSAPSPPGIAGSEPPASQELAARSLRNRRFAGPIHAR